MRQLTSADMDSLWEHSRNRVFRLEQHRLYSVPADLQFFERHQRGERVKAIELLSQWYQRIARKVGSGVRVDRLRVFDLPLPPYQQYEIDWGYAVGARYGQATWALRRELFDALVEAAALPVEDFWAFDSTVVIYNYNSALDLAGRQELSNQEAQKWLTLADALMGRCFALHHFLEANGLRASTDLIDWDVTPPNVPPIR